MKADLSWLEFEHGLAESETTARAAHFAASERHADQVLENPYAWFETRLPILIRRAYGQAFLDRKQGSVADEPALAAIRQGLAHAYTEMQAAPVHTTGKQHLSNAYFNSEIHTPCFSDEGARKGLLYKVVGLMLSARRKETLLYPSSPRESAPKKQMPLRHDGYKLLADGQKVPVKLMGIKLAAKNDKGGDFDETVRYVNLNALPKKALAKLIDRHADYEKSPLSATPPDIAEVGRLLCDEVAEGRELDRPAAMLLDALSDELADALGQRAPLDSSWVIQPADLLEPTPTPYRTKNVPSRRVPRAVELYLRYADAVPSREKFQMLIGEMRQSEDPRTRMTCMGAYIDMAVNGDLQKEDGMQALGAARLLGTALEARLPEETEGDKISAILLGGLYTAYMVKYDKKVAEKSFGLKTEASLYFNLLELGRKTLEPAKELQNNRQGVRGLQFKIGMHILNARHNLRNNTMAQFMWPSLPREATPHDFDFAHKNGWDAAVTYAGFLATHVAPDRLYFRGNPADAEFYPGITVITGRTDLGTRTTADIIDLALHEVSETPGPSRQRAREKLNEIEARFLRKLPSRQA